MSSWPNMAVMRSQVVVAAAVAVDAAQIAGLEVAVGAARALVAEVAAAAGAQVEVDLVLGIKVTRNEAAGISPTRSQKVAVDRPAVVVRFPVRSPKEMAVPDDLGLHLSPSRDRGHHRQKKYEIMMNWMALLSLPILQLMDRTSSPAPLTSVLIPLSST